MTGLTSQPLKRRSVLKGLSALGVGGTLPGLGVAQPGNVITINSPMSHRLAYQFTVTGDIWKRSQHAGGPNVSQDLVTEDPEDVIDGNRVHGITQGGFDCYGFTGQISSFDIADQLGGTNGCEHANIWVNAQYVDACQLLGGSSSQNNVITINSPMSHRLAYQFTVSGDVWKRSQHAGGPNVSQDLVTEDPEDVIDGNRVHGITQGGFDCYGFSGDITSFDIADQLGGTNGCRHANIWVNARQVDGCQLVTEP